MTQLNIDCEGPLTQNDNAFELCREFIPNGDKFFALISKYDDFLADVIKKPGYKAGDTLKLVLPFLKAFDVTDEIMEEFSEKTLLLLPGTEVMLPRLNEILPSFIISTSYRPYLKALSNLTSFPIENCFCTQVSLDKYELPLEEKEMLKKLAEKIASFDMIEWSDDESGIEGLSTKDQQTVKELDRIFWQLLPNLSSGKILEDVNPIGGVEKAKSIIASLKKSGLKESDVIYAGDSITDCQALELVRKAKGAAISFNGNRYAIREAEYAILSENTCIIAGLCCLLKEKGIRRLDSYKSFDNGLLDIEKIVKDVEPFTPSDIFSQIANLFSAKGLLEIYRIKDTNKKRLIEKSEQIRKEVRGQKIGDLG